MNANDLLTEQELYDLTGVKPGARGRTEKVIAILKKAGIYCWLRFDGSVATTWTHVHRAGQQDAGAEQKHKKPNFDGLRKAS